MAMTDKQKKARWDSFVQWYSLNVRVGRKDARPIPAELKRRYMANDGAWGFDRAMMWVRNNDPNFIHTKPAQNRIQKMKEMYEMSFGYKINWNTPQMKKYLHGFARGNPNVNINTRLTQIFRKRIMQSSKFKKENAGFMQWLSKNPSERAGADIIATLGNYNRHKESLRAYWSQNVEGAMPQSLLDKALANNWQPQDIAFQKELTQSKEWAGSQSYQDRAQDFGMQWEAIFGKGVELDQPLAEAYARNNTGLTFGDFFHKTLKHSKVFKDRFAGYADWEQKRHEAGKPEMSVDIFDYFERRNELADMWHREYTEGQDVDNDVLDRAMAENWGDALFRNKIRALPIYLQTGAGKDKASRFSMWWKTIFGETASPDPNLMSRFVGSEMTDPGTLWEDVKKTEVFQRNFSNWDIFANAQSKVGVNVVLDPAAYLAYKDSFRRSFESIGMEPPEGMDKLIFSSGLSAEDVQRGTQEWKAGGEAYKLQTGQEADLHTALGLKNKAAGGDMRLRLQKALEAQRAYAKSRIAQYEQPREEGPSGFVTQKI